MNKEFKVHLLTETGIDNAKHIANVFHVFLNTLLIHMGTEGNGREVSIVRTKLEEACFFAKKAMAISHCKSE